MALRQFYCRSESHPRCEINWSLIGVDDRSRIVIPHEIREKRGDRYRSVERDSRLKLRRRPPYEIEEQAQLDLTVSWVLAGPTVTALHEQITTALTGELATVREAIADGTEAAPTLEIPVQERTTTPLSGG